MREKILQTDRRPAEKQISGGGWDWEFVNTLVLNLKKELIMIKNCSGEREEY